MHDAQRSCLNVTMAFSKGCLSCIACMVRQCPLFDGLRMGMLPCRFGGGIPLKQYQLIQKDGIHMATYAARTFDGVAPDCHIRKDNWFYFNCLTGGQPNPSWCPWWGGGLLGARNILAQHARHGGRKGASALPLSLQTCLCVSADNAFQLQGLLPYTSAIHARCRLAPA
jgi:hypothetical protein